jgi:NTP pyrophosphatase (non-canonical NTP hydrolase)
MMNIDFLVSFQEEVGEWGNKTFPKNTPDTIVNHLCREVLELAEGHDPEEAADCFLLLLHHAHRGGYSLLKEARKKHEINKIRTWGEPDEFGVVQHVRHPTFNPMEG